MYMSARQRRSRTAAWASCISAFSVVLLLTAVVAHRWEMIDTPVCLAVLMLDLVLACLGLLLAAIAFPGVWVRGKKGGGDILRGVLLALLVLGPFLFMAYRGWLYPPLSDISTDLSDPPSFEVAAVARRAGMNPVGPIAPDAARLQVERYPQIAGRRYGLPLEDVVAAMDAVLARRGWQVLNRWQDRGGVFVEAVARTPVMAFQNDVSLRVLEKDGSVVVDMRSASRYGAHDFGDNAARIERFLQELDTAVAGRTGNPGSEPVG